MVDKFDSLKITPWKYMGQSNTDQWTLSVFHGLYNVRTKQIVRIVIVDDSKTYAIRLKHMIMRIVQVQDFQSLEIKTFLKLSDAEKYLHRFKCTLVFVDNIFPCRSTGLMMVDDLLRSEQCPTKVVVMSGDSLSVDDKPLVTKIQKKLINIETVRAFVIHAGISHRLSRRKLHTIKRKLHTVKLTQSEWSLGKDPRPLRVRQMTRVISDDIQPVKDDKFGIVWF